MKPTLILLTAVVSLAVPTLAQVDRATVTGTLRDSSSALIVNGKVTVSFPATGLTRAVTSNASGVYRLGGLPVGAAVIEVQKPGFRSIRSEIELNVGETKTLDFSLEVAGVDTSVEVVAEADLVRNSATVGATFDNTQIAQLPINGRNWGGLMTLTPGAVDTGAGNGASVRFFAQGGDDNNFRIDGVDATSVRNQAESKSRLMISEDAIAELAEDGGVEPPVEAVLRGS